METYCMRLANGQGWRFAATEETRSWVRKLVSIMELWPSDQKGYPELIFIQKEPTNEAYSKATSGLFPNTIKDLPRSGWRVHDHDSIQFWWHHDVPDVICNVGYEGGVADRVSDTLKMRLALNPIYRRAQHSGGLPIHAALIERGGTGVLLAAPSGKGKSTCCRRLPPSWRALCDDEALVVCGDGGQYVAHPFPTWSDHVNGCSGRTWNVQMHLPLVAMFFLKPTEIDEAVPIGQGQAAMFVNHLAMQVCCRSWSGLEREAVREIKRELLDNACELARAVPAFILNVSLTGRFWEEIEKVL